MCDGVSLLAVYEVNKPERISYEEDGGVIPH
jgi:hypothetical protein